MGRVLTAVQALVVYVCIGTVLAQVLAAAWCWSTGRVDHNTLVRMVAAARGISMPRSGAPPAPNAARKTNEELSLEDVARARALLTRDLELREQSLSNSLAIAKTEYGKLVDEKDRYERIKAAFKAQLDALREGAAAPNRENARLILESIKPKQAKDQILRMVKDGEIDDVVMIVAEMPVTKRARILGEFKSEEEQTTLAEILKLIREGVPEVPLIEATKQKLEQTAPTP